MCPYKLNKFMWTRNGTFFCLPLNYLKKSCSGHIIHGFAVHICPTYCRRIFRNVRTSPQECAAMRLSLYNAILMLNSCCTYSIIYFIACVIYASPPCHYIRRKSAAISMRSKVLYTSSRARKCCSRMRRQQGAGDIL